VWIVTAWQFISPAVTVQGFRMYSTCNAVDGIDGVLCGMAVKWMGMLGASVRKMKAPTDDGDSVTEWHR